MIGEIGEERGKIVEERLAEGCRQEGVKFLRDVEHGDDGQNQQGGEEICAEEFLQDKPVDELDAEHGP